MTKAEIATDFPRLGDSRSPRALWIGVTCLLLGGLTALPTRAQTRMTNPESHVDGRGTRALAYTLMLQYGKSVTVEEPLLKWEGDIGPVQMHPERPGVPVRRIKSRPLVLPKWMNRSEVPALNTEVIQMVLEEYHRQNPSAARYRVIASDIGFHILPEQEHDAEGQLVAAKPLLDTVISVPWGRGLASEHFEGIRAALAKASGVEVHGFAYKLDAIFAANGLRPPKYIEPEKRQEARALYGFDWSVDAKTAREALLELSRRSATSLYWSSLCEPKLEGPGGMCILSLMGVPEVYSISEGVTDTRVKMFDRVAKEPQFLPEKVQQQ